FTQYFMPYKKAGQIKCADENVLLNLDFSDATAHTAVYSPLEIKGAEIVLKKGEETVFDESFDLSPESVFERDDPADGDAAEYTLTVFGSSGNKLLSYAPQKTGLQKMPEPAEAVAEPKKIATNEELWLAGQHLEQYRHATFAPDPYYLEVLRRDPGDIRTNNAYGLLLLRRGQFEQSEKYFLAAIARMTRRNPNPQDSEAYLLYGLSLMFRGQYDKAYDAFYKAVWSFPQRHHAFYRLAEIDCLRHDYASALDHIDKSISLNIRSTLPRALRTRILKSLGMDAEADAYLKENIGSDAFDYASRIMAGDRDAAVAMMGKRASSYIECAEAFTEAGYFEDALDVLSMCPSEDPMIFYHKAYVKSMLGLCPDDDITRAESLSPYCVFPNRLEDMRVLSFACSSGMETPHALYYLGCILYDRRRYEDAMECWEKSSAADPRFPTVFRNLAVGYYNKRRDADAAEEALEKAFALDSSDARVLLELDQLRRKLGWKPGRRLAALEQYLDTVFLRDDLTAEYCRLLNLAGRFGDALGILERRHFHPWEGGEGKITSQYMYSLRGLAEAALERGDAEEAAVLLERALCFPENLGEGKLEGEKDNDLYYLLGISEMRAGRADAAKEHLKLASAGDEEPSSSLYYNDQPADMIFYEGLAQAVLGNGETARARFHKLISYGEKHYFDEVKLDYFAVSLPDLQLFDDDLSRINRIHCEYLMGLGYLGLGDAVKAETHLRNVLEKDPSHQGALVHSAMTKSSLVRIK
ncbi:MAG: tetratricopeptide repeat protein, partial [Clostridia bacterium]|nr:tetratricopeptide repeat protein [Clostridia bacterium]